MKTNMENYEERFVDYMEGQLSPSERQEVEAFVAQHPELEEDFKLFCNSKLEPDTSVVYTRKDSLIRPKAVVIPLFAKVAALAASVALLIGLGYRFLSPAGHDTRDALPMTASLAFLKPSLLTTADETATLQPSRLGHPHLDKTLHKPEGKTSNPTPNKTQHTPANNPSNDLSNPLRLELEATAPLATLQASQLPWQGSLSQETPEHQMAAELHERLALIEPLEMPEEEDSGILAEKTEDLASNVGLFLFSNARQFTKSVYKETAKTVMVAYYRADEYFSQSAAGKDE